MAPARPERITLGVAVDRYLAALQLRVDAGEMSPRTVANYRADLTGFVSNVGDEAIADDVTSRDVDLELHRYARRRDARFTAPSARSGDGRAVTSQIRYKQTVDRFFQHAQRQGWVQVSPMLHVTAEPQLHGLDRSPIERRSPSRAQVEALLNHGAGDPGQRGESTYRRDRLLLAMLAVLGPRVSAICHANDTDFTTAGGIETWRITDGKGSQRPLALPGWIAEWKRDYLDVRPTPGSALTVQEANSHATFRSRSGRRLTPRDVQRIVARAHQRVLAAAPEHASAAVTPDGLRRAATNPAIPEPSSTSSS